MAVVTTLLLAALMPTAQAATVFKGRFGPTPPGVGSLQSPYDVAVDAGGDIFVVDHIGHRINKYNHRGEYLMYVGKPHDANGAAQRDGQLYYPQAIATDTAGNYLYVADSGNSRVQVFSTADGAFIRKFGTLGSGDGQMDLPTGIALDEQDNVYLADSRNARVVKFTSSGTFIKAWGSYGAGDGQFKVAMGIAVDPYNGDVFVTDEAIGRFQRFSANGGFVHEYGLDSSGTGYLLNYPDEITIDAKRRLAYVIEAGGYGGGDGQEVSVFDLTAAPNQSLVGEFHGNGQRDSGYGFSPRGIHFDPDSKELLVAAGGSEGKKVFRYNTAGQAEWEVEPERRRYYTVEKGRLEFDVAHNMMFGRCDVKARGKVDTPLANDIFDGEAFTVRGPRAVVRTNVTEYWIPLTDRQVRAIRNTNVTITMTFTAPDYCSTGTTGIDLPLPLKIRYRFRN